MILTLSAPMTPVNPSTSSSSKGYPTQSTNQFESFSSVYGNTNTLGSSLGIGHLNTLADDDGRPNTPRNSSPSLALSSEFVDSNSLLVEGNHDDLLVFGYGCKIFRDDDRAKYVEDQRHLIPWMGNQDLLIDRYDCRGALTDVSRYEPGSSFLEEVEEDYNGLSKEAEGQIGKELDEERYRDLNEDEEYDERALQRELEYKRLQTAMDGVFSSSFQAGPRKYATFQYDYNEQNHDVCIGPEPKRLHEEDSPYVKPEGLTIPEGVTLPTTMKVHAIIEKTAKFIASQGNQMEIILKTKQAGNPLFEFLNHDSALNSYYKFMVQVIRSGIYRPLDPELVIDQMHSSSEAQDDTSRISSQNSLSEDDCDHTYLHPSLLRASTTTVPSVSAASIIESTVSYPSGSSSSKHNAYSMLVSKIKGTDSPDPTFQHASITSFPSTITDYQQPNDNVLGYNMYNVASTVGAERQSEGVPVRPKKQLPSSQDQLIIEKMASYVIKNGANFESVAKSKGDPRFNFLNPSHEFHWYYLNCKERYKAECNAVVATSDFVHYKSSSSETGGTSAKNGGSATATTVSVKKSAVVAELAEMKKKSIGNLTKREGKKEKNSGASSGLSLITDEVFSRGKLVTPKEKEKPVIRFSTTLSLTTTQALTSAAPVTTVKESVTNHTEITSDKAEDLKLPETEKDNINEKEEGEIDSEPEPDHLNVSDDPFEDDDTKGNSTPASEDEEKTRMRMERKRKAALFLQNLKMAKATVSSAPSLQEDAVVTVCLPQTQVPSIANITGTSLGDLLSRRLKRTETNADKGDMNSSNAPPRNKAFDDVPNGGLRSRSSSSSPSRRSRSYGRSPCRTSKKRKKRSRSRSYSSSGSLSSASSRSSYSKKKSKKKQKKKKKKYEKSTRSSHKSRRR